MANSMEVVASNLAALTEQYRVIAQNMANANTVGYKRKISQFQQELDKAAGSGGGRRHGKHSGVGREIRNSVGIDFAQGSLVQTGRKLDVAINGKGFFQIDTADGKVYSRNGTFQLNGDGQLVTTRGETVAGESGPITVPSDVSVSQIFIGTDGTLTAAGNKLGKLNVVQFDDEKALQPIGFGCLKATASAKTTETTNVRISQGFAEQSNVDAVKELIGLIRVSRLYETSVKSVNSKENSLKDLMRVAMG